MLFAVLAILGIVSSVTSVKVNDITGEWKSKGNSDGITLYIYRKDEKITGEIRFTDPALGSAFIEGQVVNFRPVFFGSSRPKSPNAMSQQITFNAVHATQAIPEEELHLSWHYYAFENVALVETVGHAVFLKTKIPEKPNVILPFAEYVKIYNTPLMRHPSELASMEARFYSQWRELQGKLSGDREPLKFKSIIKIVNLIEKVQRAFAYDMTKVLTSDKPADFNARSYFSNLDKALMDLRAGLESVRNEPSVKKYVSLLIEFEKSLNWPFRDVFKDGSFSTVLKKRFEIRKLYAQDKTLNANVDKILKKMGWNLFLVLYAHSKFISDMEDRYGENQLPWHDEVNFQFPQPEEQPGLQEGLTPKEQVFFPGSPSTINLMDKSEFFLAYDQRVRQAAWTMEYIKHGSDEGESNDRISFSRDPDVEEMFAIKSTHYDFGYDKGHLAAAANYKDPDTYAKTFGLSNAAPQQKDFNRNDWKYLEDCGRSKVNSVGVKHGWILTCLGFQPQKRGCLSFMTLDDQTTPIPTHFGKALLFETDNPYVKFHVAYYLFENKDTRTTPWDNFKTTRKNLEKHCGLKIFENIKENAMVQIHFGPPPSKANQVNQANPTVTP